MSLSILCQYFMTKILACNYNTLIFNLFITSMTLLVFDISGKTPRRKEKLKSSCSLHETWWINKLKILVGIPFRPTNFEGFRKITIFLTSVSTVDLKKIIYINCRDKFMQIILECLIEDWMSVASLTK